LKFLTYIDSSSSQLRRTRLLSHHSNPTIIYRVLSSVWLSSPGHHKVCTCNAVVLQVQSMIQQAMRDSPLAETQQQQQASGAAPTPQQQQQASGAAPTPQQQQQASGAAPTPQQQQQPLLPLIRLRVDYSGFSTINSQRFGQKFVGKVGGVVAGGPMGMLLRPGQQKLQQRIIRCHVTAWHVAV
jgi:hypothetical protein